MIEGPAPIMDPGERWSTLHSADPLELTRQNECHTNADQASHRGCVQSHPRMVAPEPPKVCEQICRQAGRPPQKGEGKQLVPNRRRHTGSPGYERPDKGRRQQDEAFFPDRTCQRAWSSRPPPSPDYTVSGRHAYWLDRNSQGIGL